MPMNKYQGLSFDEFVKVIRYYHHDEIGEDESLFDLYSDAIEILNIHQTTYENMPYAPLEHARLILHLLFDYNYRLQGLTVSQRKTQLEDDHFRATLVNTVVDKYGSLSLFKYEEGRYVTPYSMEISTINVYVNFILLKIKDFRTSDREMLLFAELLRQAFQMCRTITELLVSGFEKEALSAWRSLHELEATLKLLHEEPLIHAYERHILYHAAFNKLVAPEEGDLIFAEMKENLKALGLKSKDTRRFIEYGWIRFHKDFSLDTYKFNFRDGVESLSGLTMARETYQIASEVAHSSPLLLFTNRPYFLRLSLRSLYDSFTTIETFFADVYRKYTPPTEAAVYHQIRAQYLHDIALVKSRLQ